MSSSQDGTWIAGVVDGKPALFNIQTGETRQPQTTLPSNQLQKQLKKRQRSTSRGKQRPKLGTSKASENTFRKLLNHVATDIATHWVVGQKGGRVVYFNTITKEERWSPPEVLKNPPQAVTMFGNDTAAPIASIVHEAMFVPDQTDSLGLPTPATTDTMSVPRTENMDLDFELQIGSQKQDAELFRLLASDPQLPPPGLDERAFHMGEVTPRASLPRLIPGPRKPGDSGPSKSMTKLELRKMRNREASVRSRLKRQNKVALLEDRIKLLEKTIQNLQQTVAVKNAENSALTSQVQFLQNLVTQSMKS